MGCNERTGGQISIPGDRPKGVFTAGLAQKHLNIDGYLVGKRVYILGSGDIGLIMARRMTLEGAKVLGVSELMPYSNGLNRNIVQCLKDFDIPLRLHNTVTKIIGKPNLTAIEISDVDDNLRPIKGTEQIIECDTLLLSVGLYPINTIFTEGAHGKLYAKTKGAFVDQNLETSIPGVFSAGNVLHVHDLVDFVSMEGEIAGKNAANLILNGRKDVKKVVEVTESNNVGYVLPNIINVTDATDSVEFSFRVRKPMKHGEIIIRDGDTVVKSIKAMDLLPSEMKKVTLKTNDFESYNHLFVEVKEL
jgi:pyruvate/2-oxoglutarate dehydrogenase complex dihydrolipoamide dehydrogenase (E3) component